MCFITGFFIGDGYPGTLATLAGLLLTAFLSLETVMRNGQAIKDLIRTSSFDRSISQGLRVTFWSNFKLYVMTFALAIVVLFCNFNGTMALILKYLNLPYTGALPMGNVGLAMVAGIFSSFLFTLLFHQWMVLLMTGFNADYKLYGGERQ